MEFDLIKQKNSTKVEGKRERSHSSFFTEILDGFQEQRNEQIRHEFEEYENVDIDDICLDITMGSINEMMDIRNRVKDGFDKIQNIKAVTMIRKKKAQLEKALHDSKNVRARDRFIFVYCSILLHALVYILGSHPGDLFLYCMALTTIGFFWTRFYLYTLVGKTSHILDFPYYCSVIFSLFMVHFPGSETLYLFSFCSTLGSLSFSVYYMMNSMVMHKLNSISDLFLKLGPNLVMWNIHWNIRGTSQRAEWGFHDMGGDTLGLEFLWKYCVASTIIYSIWAVPYFMFVSMDSQKYGAIQYLKDGGFKAKLTYLSFHYLVFLVTGATVGSIAYFCQHVHILSIIIVSCVSFWNGGKYYMEYFCRNYEPQQPNSDVVGDHKKKE